MNGTQINAALKAALENDNITGVSAKGRGGAPTFDLAALNSRQRRELDRWISRPGTPDVGELIKRLTR